MKNYIQKILNNEPIMNILYTTYELYKGSYYEKHIDDIVENYQSDKEMSFLLNNTEWLFINDSGFCFGLFDRFVVTIDDEGQIDYFCHGFENVVDVLFNDEDYYKGCRITADDNNVDFDSIVNEYRNILKQEGLIGKILVVRLEYEIFLKDNA